MFSILYDFRLLSICMIVFLSLSIIFQLAVGVIMQQMVQESENMSYTKNSMLRQCRQKYINYYKLNGKMVNTTVFVDKFLKKITLFKIPLMKYLHLSGQLMFFFILTTGISIFLQLSLGRSLFDMIPYYLISILGLYLYFSVSGIINVEERKKIIQINLVDFLDNHLSPRLQVELAIAEKQQEKEKKEGKKEEKVVVNFSQQQELEELLEEFLV